MNAKQRRRRRRRDLAGLRPGELLAEALPNELTIDAEGEIEILEAAAADGAPALKKFAMVAYTGGRMQPAGFGMDVVLDLAGTDVAGGKRPILLDHDPAQPVGHAEAGGITVSAQRIRVAGVVSAANEPARQVADSSANGFPWRASIGARIHRIEFVDEGTSVNVNGKRFDGPLHVVRAATVREVSFVTLAGDDATSATVTARQNQPRREGSMQFTEWLKARGWNEADLSDEQRKTLEAAWRADPVDGPKDGAGNGGGPGSAGATGGDRSTPPNVAAGGGSEGGLENGGQAGGQASGGSDGGAANPAEAMRLQAAAEVERQERIRGLIRSGRLEETAATELHARALRENWDGTRVELEILRASRPAAPIISSTDESRRQTRGALLAALCYTAGGIPEDVIARGIAEDDLNRANERRFRSSSLHSLMDEVILQATGVTYTGPRKDNEFIRAAKRADRQLNAEGYSSNLQAASGFTTVSLTGILGDVAHKAMVAAFEAVETVHQFITKPVSHSDFKVHNRYRLDSTGAFKKVGPDGELKHAGLGDASFSAQLDTFGAIIALTRQMIFNDDLGAFTAIPTFIGRMSATRKEEAVFVLLLSNPGSFFAAGNGNLLTGATSALSIDALNDGRKLFRNQTDSNGKPVLVSPRILLVPTTLETTANQLWEAETVNVTTTANKPQFANNPHKGLYRPHVSPYLNNTGITDQDGAAISNQSDTAWFLLADPMVRAALVIASLNGRTVPIIESDDTDFSTLGMQWRGYDDFGVGTEEPQAAVRSDGV